MGVVVRLVTFLVGVLGLALVGLDTAQDHFGVDAEGLLSSMGETPGGIANSLLGLADTGLTQLGDMMSNLMGGAADPEKPTLVQSWGPESVGGIVSLLLLMFSMRR